MIEKKSSKPSRPNHRDRERYRRFAEAYLALGRETFLNAEKSALKAGYSVSYAHGRSYELLDRVGVQSEFRRIRERRAKLSTIASPEEVLETLTTVLRTLPNGLMDESGDLIPLKKLTADQAQMVAGFKHKSRTYAEGDTPVTEDTVEYRLVDRLKAAEMIGRHHGIFEKDNHQKPSSDNTRLVAYPLSELSLEEWQAQVVVIMGGTEHAEKRPALLGLQDPTGTSTGT